MWLSLKRKTNIKDDENLVLYCVASVLSKRPEEVTRDEAWQELKKVTGIRNNKLLLNYCVNAALRVTGHIIGGGAVFLGTNFGTDLERTELNELLNRYVYEDALTSS